MVKIKTVDSITAVVAVAVAGGVVVCGVVAVTNVQQHHPQHVVLVLLLPHDC